MAERKYGEPAPKTDTTIAGADWYGRKLQREQHQRTLFVDLDMTEVENIGSVFNECTFRRARFNASIHRSAAFVNCTFVSCNFFDSQFTECKAVGSMFDGCQFDQMWVIDGDWAFVGLPGADLRRASFHGTRLREADLTGAQCQRSSIRDADLSGAWLHSADFTGCDLRGSAISAKATVFLISHNVYYVRSSLGLLGGLREILRWLRWKLSGTGNGPHIQAFTV